MDSLLVKLFKLQENITFWSIRGRDKNRVENSRKTKMWWLCEYGSLQQEKHDGTFDHSSSFHMSANSSGSNGLERSHIFLLVFAYIFFAKFPALFIFSNARIWRTKLKTIRNFHMIKRGASAKWREKPIPGLEIRRMGSRKGSDL